jgi:outer membrane protein
MKTDIRTPLRPTALAFVSLTQPLTQLRRINRAIRQAQLGTQIASEQLRAKAQQTNDQVCQAYYLILQSQSSLDALQSSVDSYQELDHLTDRYLLEKTVLEPDSLRVKAELAKARYQLVAAQDTLANAKEQLNRLLSRDVTTEFRVAEVATELPEEQSLAEARKEALSHRPEIKQTQLQEQQAALDVQIEKSKYIPDISFRADYLSPINVNFVPENIASVGFVVEWQPFDWGQKKYDLAQKRTVDRQAQIRVEDAKQQILVDVDTAFRRLRETRLMLTVASAARDAESERLRVVMNQYSQKAALLDTVLQEKATLASAEDQYGQTVLGFWKARADFERALGQE